MAQQLGIQYQYPYVPHTAGWGEALGEGMEIGARIRQARDEQNIRLKQLAEQARQFELEQESRERQFDVLKGIQLEELRTAQQTRQAVVDQNEWERRNNPDVPVGDAMRAYPKIAAKIKASAGKNPFIRQSVIDRIEDNYNSTLTNAQMNRIEIELQQQRTAAMFDQQIEGEVAKVLSTLSALKKPPAPPASIIPSTPQQENPELKTAFGDVKRKFLRSNFSAYADLTTYDEDLAAWQSAEAAVNKENILRLNSLLEEGIDVPTGKMTASGPLQRINQLLQLQRQLTGIVTPTASAASRMIHENLYGNKQFLHPLLQRELDINAARYRGLTLQEDLKAEQAAATANRRFLGSETTLLEKTLYDKDSKLSEQAIFDIRQRINKNRSILEPTP